MPKKRRLKEEILEVLSSYNDMPDAVLIMKRLKYLRIRHVLKELEAEGVVEWDKEAQGFKMKEAE